MAANRTGLLVFSLGVAITLFYASEAAADADRVDQARFDLETRIVYQMLQLNMERYEERLARLADVCAQIDEVPPEIWQWRRDIYIDLNGNMPSLIHAVYCQKLEQGEFSKRVERGRDVWKERDRFVPPSDGRTNALPVWQWWSRSGFVSIEPGLDFAVEADGRPGLWTSLSSGHGWISPRPMRVARSDGGYETGFWFAQTLFRSERRLKMPRLKPTETQENFRNRYSLVVRRASLGTLASFISTDRMIEKFNTVKGVQRIHLRLYASRTPDPKMLFNPDSRPPQNPAYRRVVIQPWYGRRWRLEMSSTPFFEAESFRGLATLIFVSGIVISGLVAIVAIVALRGRLRREQSFEEVTAARDALAAAEKERERVGHDLHDGAIQSLYAVQLGLTKSENALAADPPAAAEMLSTARQKIDDVISELRGFIVTHEQAAPASRSVQFDQILTAMIRSLQPTTSTRISLNVQAEAASSLAPRQTIAFTQIARSLLSNALRHANAPNVTISLRRLSNFIELSVADDGGGFDPASRADGIGFKALRARVAEMNGSCQIDSEPGAGARLTAKIPIPSQ